MKQTHTHPIDYRRSKCKKSPCQLKLFFNDYVVCFNEDVDFRGENKSVYAKKHHRQGHGANDDGAIFVFLYLILEPSEFALDDQLRLV